MKSASGRVCNVHINSSFWIGRLMINQCTIALRSTIRVDIVWYCGSVIILSHINIKSI